MNRTSVGLVMATIGLATMASPFIGGPPPFILVGLIVTLVGGRMFSKAADPKLGISQAPIAFMFFAFVFSGIMLMLLWLIWIMISAVM